MTRGGIALVAAALLVPTLVVRAAPLDKDGCARLKMEQAQLEQAGTRGGMGRGPEWAKANLAPEKLEQIRRLIEVDEQLLFRCQGRPLVNLPRDPDPAAREVESKGAPKRPVAKAGKPPEGEKKAGAPVKKAAAPPVDPAAKAVAKEAPAAKAASPSPPAPAKKESAESKQAAAKAKTKGKANDAYRPPAGEWSSNPFADQMAPAAKK